MQILADIKISRLVLAIFATLLIADTVPHPSLSAGLMESSLQWVKSSLANTESAPDTAIADLGQ